MRLDQRQSLLPPDQVRVAHLSLSAAHPRLQRPETSAGSQANDNRALVSKIDLMEPRLNVEMADAYKAAALDDDEICVGICRCTTLLHR